MIKKYGLFYICLLSYAYSGLLVPSEQLENTIELQVEESIFHSITITLGIGSPPQYFTFYFSTILQKLYIADGSNFPDGFDPSKSSSFRDESRIITLPYAGYNSKGKYCFDTIQMSIGLNVKDYPFVLITEGLINYKNKGTIGFEYLTRSKAEDEYSFMKRLKNIGMINKEIFYIDSTGEKPRLILGGSPLITQLQERRGKKCKLINVMENSLTNNPLWQCNLNAIYFDDDDFYPVKKRITFSIGGNVICVDQVFFVYLKMHHFQNELNSGNCWEETSNSNSLIICRSSYTIKSMKQISIMIGKWNLKYNVNDLFSSYSYTSKYFEISYCHSNLETPFEWSIGYKHLKNLTIVFDKESGYVALYQ